MKSNQILKEGNAATGLAHNSYHLMHHASEKDFKISRRWQMHRGLPCVIGESGSTPQMSKKSSSRPGVLRVVVV
jgi:L,D-peptidoglycan transpeptidase YkuD (ErfK/YbiS/YcfS/YnhG family)